jgi:hypothetical protein
MKLRRGKGTGVCFEVSISLRVSMYVIINDASDKNDKYRAGPLDRS